MARNAYHGGTKYLHKACRASEFQEVRPQLEDGILIASDLRVSAVLKKLDVRYTK